MNAGLTRRVQRLHSDVAANRPQADHRRRREASLTRPVSLPASRSASRESVPVLYGRLAGFSALPQSSTLARMPRQSLKLIALVAGSILVVVLFFPWMQWCDGNAPGWVENRGGCASWALWEYLLPWHWGVPDQCLGLCPDSLQMP